MEIEQISLLCGAIAGPFFVATLLIEGAFRRGYHPMRQPGSALAIGPRGWVQRANFFITGALAIAYASGLSAALRPYGGSFWVPMLVGGIAVGLTGAGVFTTDVTGLLEDRAKLANRTLSGKLHDLFGVPTLAGLCIACFAFAYLLMGAAQWGWAAYCTVSGIAMVPCFVLAAAGFDGSPRLANYGGLFQRLSIGFGFLCLSLVATHLLVARFNQFERI
jgi:hypothetical protein